MPPAFQAQPQRIPSINSQHFPSTTPRIVEPRTHSIETCLLPIAGSQTWLGTTSPVRLAPSVIAIARTKSCSIKATTLLAYQIVSAYRLVLANTRCRSRLDAKWAEAKVQTVPEAEVY